MKITNYQFINDDIIIDDYPNITSCSHPNHGPSINICIPEGKKLIHICPSCKEVFIRRNFLK